MAARRQYHVPPGLTLAALLILAVPFLIAQLLPAGGQEAPLWWDVVLNLKAEGEYTLEGGDSSCRGRFYFSLSWSGWMERDEEDYLLYRFRCDLSDWRAEETSTSSGATSVFLTADFLEKPSLDLKYILRRGGELHLNFVVNGIAVPQSASRTSWPLLFPSSEENDQRGERVAYNACVAKGSNRVALEEKEIYAGPAERKFAWDWKHQQWQIEQQHNVFNSQMHRAEVSLSIIPRCAPSKSSSR
jgi:hypothetical protein